MSTPLKNSIYIVSDSTGETAATMIRAALVHFPEAEVNIVRYKNVRNENQVESLVDEAFEARAMIIYTIIAPKLRDHLRERSQSVGLFSFDLLGPLLGELSRYLNVSQESHHVGALRAVDERYFKRIEAIEYTVKHDDGKCLTDLDKADIILIGISRTSKTPLSIFLSHKGWKVANIPLVLNQPIPQEIFSLDQRKIVGLIIDLPRLQTIRRNRLEKFGTDPGGEYASQNYIQSELAYAEDLFRKNRRWPVFNVTERALEETASEITRIVSSRMGWPDSALF